MRKMELIRILRLKMIDRTLVNHKIDLKKRGKR